jgi:lipid-binding SYLF domain-containing protein
MLRPSSFLWLLLALVLGGVAPSADARLGKQDKDKERAEIRAESREVLDRLYAARPEARAVVEGAVGYATFQNKGLKLGLAGGGRGRGIAVARDGRVAFMKFLEVQAGIGLGVKKYDLVFVFANRQALVNFVHNGWQYSGQTTLSAKTKDAGRAYQGAVAVSPGVWLYQLTEAGLAAEITVKGTKYSKDKDLN